MTRWRDVVATAGPTVVFLSWAVLAAGPDALTPPILLATISLAARIRWPTAAAGAFAVGVLLAVAGFPVPAAVALPLVLAVLTAAYAVAVHSRWPWLGLPLLAAPLLPLATKQFELRLPGGTLPFALLAAAWLAGVAVRRQRDLARAWQERAGHVEREQEALRSAAMAQERARIARDLHDVVTHRVSVMVIQGGAARSVLATDPGTACGQLLALEAGGREALAELRGLLDLLAVSSGDPDPSPPQGIAAIPALVEQVRAAGLPVRYEVTGAARPVPDRLDRTAYRIVQEALTNALRHSARTGTAITVDYGQSALVLEAVDDGPFTGEIRAGRGLAGMGERAALVGGTVDYGHSPPRGFAVRAVLPWPPEVG
jgi:signal transduction histidine kinase